MNSSKVNRIVLIVLDGWGLAPESPCNPISCANLPFYKSLLLNFPNTRLLASGEAVGLLNNSPGNTSIGHLNLAAGRIVKSPLREINEAIEEGSFFKNKAFKKIIRHLKKHSSALHLLGLFGLGHVHSSTEHLLALLELAKINQIEKVYLHLFTDGRDSPPKSALTLFSNFEEKLKKEKLGVIATIAGRFYAMDRDRRWPRTEKAFEVLKGLGKKAKSASLAIRESYQNGTPDEFIKPTVLTDNQGNPLGKISQNDGIIFFNHRGERAIQLSELILKKKQNLNLFFLSLTEFDKHLMVSAVAFPPRPVEKTLGEVISEYRLRQLRLAETEKARFVTYYFNGFREKNFPLEKRIIIPSPRVPTYDLKPEMSALELIQALFQEIEKNYSFILLNFANPDMVGHTGLFKATVRACETIDLCLKKIIEKTLATDSLVIITADHGNAEEKIDLKTGLTLTEHTNNPVPFILVDKNLKNVKLREGILADVAPTILNLLGLPKPVEMTGKNLIKN